MQIFGATIWQNSLARFPYILIGELGFLLSKNMKVCINNYAPQNIWTVKGFTKHLSALV